MRNYRTLTIYDKSVNLSTSIYSITRQFPKEEMYGITSQLRRASVSIPANIAEGAGRNTTKDFNRFLAISLGSTFELETLLLISRNLGYINNANYENVLAEVVILQKMIVKLKQTIMS